jgi:hypothetical protein
LRLAARAVVAPGQAARRERRAALRAGKVGEPLDLVVARPGLATAKLVRPAMPAALREPAALKLSGVAAVGGTGSPPGRRSLQTGKGRGEWDAAPQLKPGALQVAPRLRARLLISRMPRPDQVTRPFRSLESSRGL